MAVGFVRGTFSLPHVGHYRLLKEAHDIIQSEDFFGKIIVFIDSDKRVEKLKGRVLYNEDDRHEILSSCCYVDGVYIFDTERGFRATIRNIIQEHSENEKFYYFKGGDYKPDDLPEKKFLTELGVEVRCLSHSGHSTTNFLEQFQKLKV